MERQKTLFCYFCILECFNSWFVPGFIQGWRTWGESKISSFVSGVNQGKGEMERVQDFLA